MRTLRKIKIALFCCTAALHLPLMAATVTDPIWRESIGGSPIAAPVTAPEAVFITGDNKALQAFHRSGRLLWRTYFKYKLRPEYTVTGRTFIYVCDSRRNLHALNRNGTLLWTVQLEDTLICPPLADTDGRLYLTYTDRIECRTFSGRRKWILELEAEPAQPPAANGNTGGLTVLLKNRTFFTVSPFGEKSAAGTVNAPAEQCRILPFAADKSPRPELMILTIEPGLAVCSRLSAAEPDGEKTFTACWQAPITGLPAAAAESDGILGIVTDRGTLYLAAAADGTLLASIPLPVFSYRRANALQPAWVSCFREKWYVGSAAGISAVTAGGSVSWTFQTAKNRTTPVMSSEGDIYTAGNDWILYAYRAETRIQDSAPLYEPETQSPGIAHHSTHDREAFFYADEWSLTSALARIETSLQNGTNGHDEIADTRCLAKIAGDTGGDPFGARPDASKRAKACLLLGMTGTEDARIQLCAILAKEKEPAVQRSALQGLEMIGMDFQGKSIAAIKNLVAASPVRTDESVLLTACDTLFAISRTMGAPFKGQGISCLALMMKQPFSERTRKKAAETIQKLAQ